MKTEYPDPRKIDEIYEKDYIRAGFKQLGLDLFNQQAEIPDEAAFSKKLFDLVTSREADRNTKSDAGWTAGEVYSNLFPGAPGADGTPVEQLDLNERGAYAKHLRRIGQLCNSGTRGFVQSRLAEEPAAADGTRRVLCHGKITRGYDLVDGFWVTRDPDLILDSWDKKVEKWAKEADSLRNFGKMLLNRQPAIAEGMAKSLRSGEARAKGSLAELNAPAPKALTDKSSA